MDNNSENNNKTTNLKSKIDTNQNSLDSKQINNLNQNQSYNINTNQHKTINNNNNHGNLTTKPMNQNDLFKNTEQNKINNYNETLMLQKSKEDEFKKKQKIENIKSFLQLKTKINQLLSLHKIEEAKQTYHSLYKIYQQLINVVSDSQKQQFEDSISTIYKKLNDEINNKRVKRGNIDQTTIIKKPKDRIRKVAITTDIDVVLKIIDEKGRLTLSDIESQLSINRKTAEEWIQILADAKLIKIKYLPVGGIEITRIE